MGSPVYCNPIDHGCDAIASLARCAIRMDAPGIRRGEGTSGAEMSAIYRNVALTEAGRVLSVEARIAVSAIAAESLPPERLAVFPMSVGA